MIHALHRFYKILISPFFGESCRFHPTCSDYCVEAINQHGFWRGLALSFGRILRCQPYCTGGLDPVPPKAAKI